MDYDTRKNSCQLIASQWKQRTRARIAYFLRGDATMQPFLILCEARTGSGLLSDYLNSLDNVVVGGEVLNPYVSHGLRPGRSKRRVRKHLRDSLYRLTAPVCGAKVHLSHLEMQRVDVNDLLEFLPTCKFVILYRKSLGRQFISALVLRKTRRFGLGAAEKQEQVVIRVEPNELEAYCNAIRLRYKAIMEHPELRRRSTIISYEELAADAQVALESSVFPLLEVSGTVATGKRRQGVSDIGRQVENYNDKLRELLEYAPQCKLDLT